MGRKRLRSRGSGNPGLVTEPPRGSRDGEARKRGYQGKAETSPAGTTESSRYERSPQPLLPRLGKIPRLRLRQSQKMLHRSFQLPIPEFRTIFRQCFMGTGHLWDITNAE